MGIDCVALMKRSGIKDHANARLETLIPLRSIKATALHLNL